MIRRQFPLKPAAAMAIYKAQGMFIPAVAVSFRGRVHTHVVYVALSRVKSLSGLHILDLDTKKILVDSQVVEETQRLRQHKQISLEPSFTLESQELIVILLKYAVLA